jgi:hypothetical protein
MATTDKELLELAAKAAAIAYDPARSEPHPTSGAWFGLWLRYDREPHEFDRRYWNPLTDDGDALRLAVKLRIKTVHWDAHGTTRASTVAVPPYEAGLNDVVQFSDGDDYAAARRAIVRAAAEIGRASTTQASEKP